MSELVIVVVIVGVIILFGVAVVEYEAWNERKRGR
jgi:Tfp pilus assembly protein FimT